MVHNRSFEYEQDEAFIWELYCSTRTEEMAHWGWSESDKLAFLQSQYAMQQKSYQMQFPAQNHQIILRSEQPMAGELSFLTPIRVMGHSLARKQSALQAGLSLIIICSLISDSRSSFV